MKKTITILTLALSIAFTKAQTTNGLIAHYPFNESTTDASTSGNNGTIVGSSRYTKDRDYNLTSALEFTMSNDATGYMNAAVTNANRGFFTISCWIYPTDSNTGISKIINYGLSSTGKSVWSIEQSKGSNGYTDIRGYAYADENYKVYSEASYSVPLDQWVHIALTFNTNDSLILYVNGKKASSTKVAFTELVSVAKSMRFGHAAGSYNTGFNPIDEYRLYNRRLTYEEIAEIYTTSATSIQNFSNKYELTLFPNPCNENIEIKGVSLSDKMVELVGTDGKIIAAQKVDNRILLADIPAGVYSLLVKSQNGEIEAIKPLVKQ